MLRRTRQTLILLAFAGATSALLPLGHAAELGEAKVASHIGQQLVADIELTMLEDAGTPVAVRMASPEVYAGAGIAVPPVVSALTFSVMRRDGRQFLHVTSVRPVAADHLHLYLELVDRGQRSVRLVTLWLTPDPNPAPVAVAAPAPAAAPVAAAAPALAAAPASLPAPGPGPAPAPAPVRAAPALAMAAPAARPQRRAALAPVPKEVAEAVAPEHAAKKPEPAPRPAPAEAAMAEAPKRAAPIAVAAKPAIGTFRPIALAMHTPAPAACVPQAEAKACAALDGKNAELKARIGHLEERVKGLQASLGAAPAVAVAAAAAAAAAPGHAPATVPAVAIASAPAHAPVPAPQTVSAKPQPHAEAPAAVPVHASAPAASDGPKAAPAAAPGPRPIAAIKPLKPIKPIKPHAAREPASAPPEAGLPWGWIGAGAALVLALAGGGAAFLLRRRAMAARAAKAVVPPGPRLIDRLGLRQRIATPSQAMPEAVEPSLE